jgi:inositol-pentakisphosphate 2-kinase
MADILQTKPANWKYVSEGGATIVFSYAGPSHPEFDGTVLRLRKSIFPAEESRGKAVPVVPTESTDGEPDDPTIDYQTKCMKRLIPHEHLPRLRTVQLDRLWLEELAKLQNSVRPEERREKDEIDLKRKKGVLATDLVGGNWLAVEIKVSMRDASAFLKASHA